jgi:secondary thiamine-phosphate synthase enzyme
MGGVTEFFEIETTASQESFDITERVRDVVARAGLKRGLCHVMVLHSTCAVVVNETADPNIGKDVLRALGEVFPERDDWLHNRRDDNAASHLRASALGPSESVPIVDGALLLGKWQAFWLFEFDGPRTRRVAVHLLEG